MSSWLCVVVHTPAHSALGPVLTYRSAQPLPPGTLVRVPLGKRETLGVVWEAAAAESTGEIDPDKVRDIAAVLEGIAPLAAPWQQLVRFAAQYYQRSPGEVALAALPLQLRDLSREQLQRRLKRKPAAVAAASTAAANGKQATPAPALSAEQANVLAQLHRHSGPFLLLGATGSGKTEVYLRCVQDVLADHAQAQALVMVPEINLTPQLEARFLERFAPLFGPQAVVSLHSGMTPAQRLGSWLAAHSGSARIVLGTRMAVFASLPCLRLIVVDEEHDPSYKSSEGARYSARDLAVYRGKLEGAKVLLGSATPSLESWHHSRPASAGGRYQRLLMPSRMGQVAGPAQQAGAG
ncbi:MAG: DEAD/DEAH box helicase, partial [Rhodoferax sp.]|nr:DEAD/DEAH box helicase [Rhodoferax sp.]